MAAADQALYQAKRLGKDRHEMHQETELLSSIGMLKSHLPQLRRA